MNSDWLTIWSTSPIPLKTGTPDPSMEKTKRWMQVTTREKNSMVKLMARSLVMGCFCRIEAKIWSEVRIT